jgi:hypothetical protein
MTDVDPGECSEQVVSGQVMFHGEGAAYSKPVGKTLSSWFSMHFGFVCKLLRNPPSRIILGPCHNLLRLVMLQSWTSKAHHAKGGWSVCTAFCTAMAWSPESA